MGIRKIVKKLKDKTARKKEKVFNVYCTSEQLCVMIVKARNKKEAREKAEIGDFIDIEDDYSRPRFLTGDVEEVKT